MVNFAIDLIDNCEINNYFHIRNEHVLSERTAACNISPLMAVTLHVCHPLAGSYCPRVSPLMAVALRVCVPPDGSYPLRVPHPR